MSRNFPGFNNFLQMGDVNIKATSVVTVAGFCHIDAYSGDQDAYLFHYGSELQLRWFRNNAAFRTGGSDLMPGTTATATWLHIAGVQIAAGGSGNRRFFINGALFGQSAGVALGSSAVTSFIGDNTGGAGSFDGRACEVCLWNEALSDAEILALSRRVPPSMVRPKNIKGYWPLWGVAFPEPDLSGNGKHATLSVGSVTADPTNPGMAPPVPIPY